MDFLVTLTYSSTVGSNRSHAMILMVREQLEWCRDNTSTHSSHVAMHIKALKVKRGCDYFTGAALFLSLFY